MRAVKGLSLWILVAALGAVPARGQQWALSMFDHTRHDFGTVARGAKAEHRFTFQNVYEEDLSVSVTSTCNCTIPSVTQSIVHRWEKAAVVATLDTRAFTGVRHATLRVAIRGYKGGMPFDGEVLLDVNGVIRQDVVVQPGVVDLGSVPQGSAVERRATIAYAGNPNWQITAVENGNPSLNVRLVEAGRDIQRVNYDLTVSVKPDAPPGYIKDQLMLVTNDANLTTARVPVPVEGLVMPGLTVHPAPLVIQATAGAKAQAKLLVKSHAPFHVTGVTCRDSRFQFELPTAAGSLQWIRLTFAAGAAVERVSQTLHITTDAAGSSQIEAAIQVNIAAATGPTPPPAVTPKIVEPQKLDAQPKAGPVKDATTKSDSARPAKSMINGDSSIPPASSEIPTWRARPRMVPFPQEPPAKPDKPDAPAPAEKAPSKKAPAAKKSAVEL